ncbi:hypothetical protein F2P81_006661 [Scophthalmus maximus]|uniref:Uncharacterized protein n=1 Tax=Scophthalmus maximus TaxID=52904 RepID=A0A6A4T3Z1_SCOMX|nr:hypothetical protein F2P81_006661 [Scophthalmus maximus]
MQTGVFGSFRCDTGNLRSFFEATSCCDCSSDLRQKSVNKRDRAGKVAPRHVCEVVIGTLIDFTSIDSFV